jgi:hypothetical protein
LAIRDLEQWYASGGDCAGGVHNPAFQGENPRSGLNWLCMSMPLMKVLFYERGLTRLLVLFWRCSTVVSRNRSL